MLLSKKSAQKVYFILKHDGTLFLKNTQNCMFAQLFVLSPITSATDFA